MLKDRLYVYFWIVKDFRIIIRIIIKLFLCLGDKDFRY